MEIWLATKMAKPWVRSGCSADAESIRTRLMVQTVYLIELDAGLAEPQRHHLSVILQAKPITDYPKVAAWIVPRPGLRTAWSTKVQALLSGCQCVGVQRIEHAELIAWAADVNPDQSWLSAVSPQLFDRMTAVFLTSLPADLWRQDEPQGVISVPVLTQGVSALQAYNDAHGLSLSDDECQYLSEYFISIARDPTDVELMMFAQVNSEHCRHKRFNATWLVDGVRQPRTLFDSIRHTYAQSPQGVVVAYRDNAAVLDSHATSAWMIGHQNQQYGYRQHACYAVSKVETHNHPTAVSPYPGAATGAGGEIRDEGATGRGAWPRAGLCGYAVSDLCLPNLPQPWEHDIGKPTHLASAMDIMIEAPVGAADYQNEFGRPCLLGFFRTLMRPLASDKNSPVRAWGFHKPMMVAGGVGLMDARHAHKKPLTEGALLLVLGGPAMNIGVGGGGASSRQLGEHADLDFSAVQRGNPEIQRRCQAVINVCVAMASNNPIISIHDVGAGGLSNALPELVESAGGGYFHLRAIPNAEPALSPMAIWCNEAQERYVLAIEPQHLEVLQAIAERERCPLATVGCVKETGACEVWDACFSQMVVDMPLQTLFEKLPFMTCKASTLPAMPVQADPPKVDLSMAIERVLQCPAVASKAFLIHIADRSVGGLVARDPLVGPWQMPVADVAVVADVLTAVTGMAMAMGERSPLAVIDAAAAARMAVGESITNLLAADVPSTAAITLSANWMAACGAPGMDADLVAAVQAVGDEFCPALDVCIPVGKDSLSMRTQWREGEQAYDVYSPSSLVATAYAPVKDITRTWTPQLMVNADTVLLLIDCAADTLGLGGSSLAQVMNWNHLSGVDAPQPGILKATALALAECREAGYVLAYHDRSDGGLMVTLVEMSFASRVGMDVWVMADQPLLTTLFHESLGMVVQVHAEHMDAVSAIFSDHQLGSRVHRVATLNAQDEMRVFHGDTCVWQAPRSQLLRYWWSTSHAIRCLRDGESIADQELAAVCDPQRQAPIGCLYDFDYPLQPAPQLSPTAPQVAVLREQGCNGYMELAAAFHWVGFRVFDVTMTDLLAGRVCLDQFRVLAVCGGFSFGDALGAGRGWAYSILHRSDLRQQFECFFKRTDTLTLGVCNGCQMLSHLRELIPGAQNWPTWEVNQSGQFESRLVTLKITDQYGIWWQGMSGSLLPVVVAHGEGRACGSGSINVASVAAVYSDAEGYTAHCYPDNPNGSEAGVAACSAAGGRVMMMMPHPERMLYHWQWSWSPAVDQSAASPWVRLFSNAYAWCQQSSMIANSSALKQMQ